MLFGWGKQAATILRSGESPHSGNLKPEENKNFKCLNYKTHFLFLKLQPREGNTEN